MQSQHSQRTQNTSVNGDYNAVGPGAQVIVNTYNTLLQTLPVNLKTLVLPLIEHYAADLFGGREAELAMLNAFLADPEQHYGLLVAPTGLGKTALLVRWLARLQEQPSNWRIIFAPVSIRYQTASEQVTLSILAHNLAAIHNDLEQFRTQDQSAHSLRAVIGDYLRRPLPDGSQLLLVLDGIDEATGWELGPLCAVMPQSGLKILVAARQRADMLRDDWQYQLGWANYPVSKLDLHQLDRSAVELFLAQNAPRLGDDPAFVEQFYRVSEGDPLTCNLLLKALQSGQVTVDSLTNRPPGLEAFLKDWVNKLRDRRKTSKAIRELLALCAAAYGPLNSDDLQALAPEVFEEQAEVVDAVHDDEVARFIITVGEHTYVFSHQRLREVFLEQIYPVKDRAKLQQRMITYGAEWYADRSQPLPDYLRQFWIAHLREAREWERIRTVLTEIVPSSNGRYHIQPWQNARYNAEGSDTGYLNDLDLLWTWAEEQNLLALVLRCALIAASLRSRSGNLSPELLVQLVKVGTTEGKWSPAAALEQIAHMPDPQKQVNSIKALMEAGIVLPWDRALEIARSISDGYSQVFALIVISPQFPLNEQLTILSDALKVTQTITPDGERAEVLAMLAPFLPSDLLTKALQVAHSINQSMPRIEILTTLVKHLLPSDRIVILTELLQVTRSIPDDSSRAQTLASLAPYFPTDECHTILTEALQIVRSIPNDSSRAQALASLSPYFPTDECHTILAEALQIVRSITVNRDRAEILTKIVSYFPSSERANILDEVLQALSSITNGWIWVEALTALVPHLSPKLLSRTLQVAHSITNESIRAELLTTFAPYLPHMLLRKALQSAFSITNELYRIPTLVAFAPHLLPKQIAELLEVACSTTNEDDRAGILRGLIPYLLPYQLNKALQATKLITSEENRINILQTLVPYLSSNQFTEILQLLQTIRDEREQIQIFMMLVHYLLPHQFGGVLRYINSMIDERNRALGLEALAPHLEHGQLNEALQTAYSIKDKKARAETLTILAIHFLSSERTTILDKALQAACTVNNEEHRTRALMALIPILPPDRLSEILQTSYFIDNEYYRAQIIIKIVPHLPQDLLKNALQVTSSITDEKYQAIVIATLTPYLAVSEQVTNLSKTLKIIKSIIDIEPFFINEYEHTRALRTFVTHLPHHLFNGILQRIESITHEWGRAKLLEALSPHLAPDLLTKAIQITQAITDEEDRANVLSTLALYLPPELLNKSIQVAYSISDQKHRLRALIALSPYLPATEQITIPIETLHTTLNIANDTYRAKTLISLIPFFSSSDQHNILYEALQSARNIAFEEERVSILTKLAPYFLGNTRIVVLTEALKAAHSIIDYDQNNRSHALSTIAPLLASEPNLDHLFRSNLRTSAMEGRQNLLEDLAALMPWLEAVVKRANQPTVISELADSVIEVARCWP